jgi:hypothetical protein
MILSSSKGKKSTARHIDPVIEAFRIITFNSKLIEYHYNNGLLYNHSEQITKSGITCRKFSAGFNYSKNSDS